MNDSMISLVLQCLKNLYCKSPYQSQRNSLEAVVLNKLIEIDAQKLKGYDQMLSEYGIVFDTNDVVHIVRVVLLQVVQDIKFHTGLVVEPLFVSNNL